MDATNTMDSTIRDAELIALFLDGKLTEIERREFLERLDVDDAFHEVFLESARYHHEETRVRGEAPVIRHRPTSVMRNRPWLMIASAAAVAAIVITTVVMLRQVASFSAGEAGRLLIAESLVDQGLELKSGWYEQGWSRTRGITPIGDEAEAIFRIGVRVVDLDVALRAKAREDAVLLIYRLERLVDRVELAAPLRMSYLEVRRHLEEDGALAVALELAEVSESLAEAHFDDLSYVFAFGRWAEAGRLAAASDNEELLRSRSFRYQLRSIRRHQWADTVEAQLDIIEPLLRVDDSELRFDQLLASFTAILDES